MSDFRFSTEVTVRFAETDAQGVAHNANYLVWFEVARVAYLAEYAGGYPALREQGLESFVLEPAEGGCRLTWQGELGTDLWALGSWWGTRVGRSWERAVRVSMPPVVAEAERRAGSKMPG